MTEQQVSPWIAVVGAGSGGYFGGKAHTSMTSRTSRKK